MENQRNPIQRHGSRFQRFQRVGEIGWLGLIGDILHRLAVLRHQQFQRRREMLGADEIERRQLVRRAPVLQQRVAHDGFSVVFVGWTRSRRLRCFGVRRWFAVGAARLFG
ncbi:hypothetical protein ABD440_02570 [Chromobacterium piscinae]|uniref:hypothetical protein n=1 Tax=Chromobacterium piscinae TaxID=686831 RepID=UPI0031FD5DA7